MTNLTKLREAQRMVCDAYYTDYYNQHTGEYDGHCDDIVWQQAYNKKDALPRLAQCEAQYIQNPNIDTALQYWQSAALESLREGE